MFSIFLKFGWIFDICLNIHIVLTGAIRRLFININLLKAWRKYAHGQIASRIGVFIPETASSVFSQPHRILFCFLHQLHIVKRLLISTEGVMRFSSKIGVESLAHVYK